MDWNCDVLRKSRCLFAVLLVLLCSPITWAQNEQAPTVVTLVPIDVTEASATLRAEVNPNGLPTNVEFSVTDYLGEIVYKNGSVAAGQGTEPLVVQFRVSGLPPWPASFWIRVKASNSAGGARGFAVPLHRRYSYSDPFVPGYITPAVAMFPVSAITERGAIIKIEVNPMGFRTLVQLRVGFAIGNTRPVQYRYLWLERKAGSGNVPVRMEFEVTGLYRGTTYEVGANGWSYPRSDYGAAGVEPEIQIFKTLGEPGHNPPEFPNVALRVPIGSAKSFTRLIEPFDPDGDTFSIESISQPQHGTVSLDFMEWTYTPNSTYDGTDQFSVTVVDSKGERTTRIVQIYDVRPRAFEFDLGLDWNVSDPPRPAGRLTLTVTVAGAFSGKVSIFGENYVLRGSFDPFDEAVLELDRKGLPPLVVNLRLVPGVDGEMHLSAEIQAPELEASYVAEGLPVGNAETSEGVAGLRYTAVLPMQDGTDVINALASRTSLAVASDTPQGDGFLIGAVDKRGRARFTGRTGDGQTFTLGGRLQRNRRLQVGIATGRQPRDYIVGHLDFTRDDTKSVEGSLGWLSYRNQNEYYARDFTRVVEPKGAAYRKPKAAMNPFAEAGGSSELQVKLLDDVGTPVVNSAISIDRKGNASLSGDYQMKLHFDRKSGLFRGTLRGTGISSKTSFMGALVQPLKRGQGHLLLNGPVGAVTLSTPMP